MRPEADQAIIFYRRSAIRVQMKVSIIGTPHCGRTVFLGLLYEALIRMGTADGDEAQEVILSTGPVEAKAFGDLRLELISGRWPTSGNASKVSGRMLTLGFRKKRSFPFFRSRELTAVELEDVPLAEKDIIVMRGTGQLRDVLLGSPGGSVDRHGLSERFRDSLDGDAIILLADVSKEEKEGSWPRAEKDAFLATFVENATRTDLGKARKVNFLVVLTKAERAEADDDKVFEEAFPRTSGTLHQAFANNGSASHTIVSWVGTVEDSQGMEVPTTTVRDGQVRIDYSEKEYRRLIGIIGDIA